MRGDLPTRGYPPLSAWKPRAALAPDVVAEVHRLSVNAVADDDSSLVAIDAGRSRASDERAPRSLGKAGLAFADLSTPPITPGAAHAADKGAAAQGMFPKRTSLQSTPAPATSCSERLRNRDLSHVPAWNMMSRQPAEPARSAPAQRVLPSPSELRGGSPELSLAALNLNAKAAGLEGGSHALNA